MGSYSVLGVLRSVSAQYWYAAEAHASHRAGISLAGSKPSFHWTQPPATSNCSTQREQSALGAMMGEFGSTAAGVDVGEGIAMAIGSSGA